MDIMRPHELERLTASAHVPSASLFMPTHRAGAGTAQDPIRFKNLLTRADGALRALGMRTPEASELLAPARDLLGHPSFWSHQAEGLAVFASAASFKAVRLPLTVPERAVVGARFHVKPLLPYFSADGHFFVLAISQNQIRLLEGSRDAFDEVDLGEVPTSLAEALHHEDPERELQLHVAGGGPAGRAIFHGHGAGAEIDKERLDRYFREVDRGVGQILRGEQAPVVLAGVGYATARYRELSAMGSIMSEAIAGNPDELRLDQLHERASAIVEPTFRSALRADLDRFSELDGTGLTTTGVIETLTAAEQGRVAVLFAAADQERWGSTEDGAMVIRDEPLPGDEDLIDAAVVAALRTDARVHVLKSEALPAAPAAAILRY